MTSQLTGGRLGRLLICATFTVAVGGWGQQPGGGYQQGQGRPGFVNNGGQIQGQVQGQYTGPRGGQVQYQAQGQRPAMQGQGGGQGEVQIPPPPPLNLNSRFVQQMQHNNIKRLKVLNESAMAMRTLLQNSSRFTYQANIMSSMYSDQYLAQMSSIIGNGPGNTVWWAMAFEGRAKAAKDSYLEYLAYYVRCYETNGGPGQCWNKGKHLKLNEFLFNVDLLRNAFTNLDAGVRAAQLTLSQTYLLQNSPYAGTLYQNEQVAVLNMIVELENYRVNAEVAICELLQLPGFVAKYQLGNYEYSPATRKHAPGIFCPRCYQEQNNWLLPRESLQVENSLWLNPNLRLAPMAYYPPIVNQGGGVGAPAVPMLNPNAAYAPPGYVPPQINVPQQNAGGQPGGGGAPANQQPVPDEFSPAVVPQNGNGGQPGQSNAGQAPPAGAASSQVAPQALPGQAVAPQGFAPASSSTQVTTQTSPAQGSPGLLGSPASSGNSPPAYYGGQPGGNGTTTTTTTTTNGQTTPQITPVAPPGVTQTNQGNMGFAPAGGGPSQ